MYRPRRSYADTYKDRARNAVAALVADDMTGRSHELATRRTTMVRPFRTLLAIVFLAGVALLPPAAAFADPPSCRPSPRPRRRS